jgi:hypothetical protein
MAARSMRGSPRAMRSWTDAEVDLWQERTRLQSLKLANNAEWLTTIAMGDAVGITALGYPTRLEV